MSATPTPETSTTTATASTSSTSTTTTSSTTPFASARKGAPPPPKPVNVFTNDGSFLTRFKKADNEASVEQQKRDEALARKKAADDRIKNRGKRRPAPYSTSSDAKTGGKGEEGLSEYQKQMKKMQHTSLREEGSGIRPVLK